MSSSVPQRNRPILKRPGRSLSSLSESQPAQPVVSSEELALESAAEADEADSSSNSPVTEEVSSALDTASVMGSRGQALEWSGFGETMEAAIAKELLTDWRFDC